MLSARRVGLSAPQSAFLQSSMEQAMKQVGINIREDEYKVWKKHPTLAEDDPLVLGPIQYWQLHAKQFPVLVKFAINVPTIPAAAAADCERTFNELSHLQGTRRLCVKPELPAALQSLES
jgi:hypothetical protein